jgi:SRSO17 transposase
MEIHVRDVEKELIGLMNRMANVFTCEPGFQNAQKYIKGLMGNAERKNSWQMAEYLGEATPYSVQQFLYRGRFSADKVRDVMREYTNDNLGDDDGVLVFDDTGFLKKGTKSCGVKRQYTGTAGRIENCQIGVFLTYASQKGHTPIDRRLYLPKEWIDDDERRKGAGIPEEIVFKTKPELALDMLKDATDFGILYSWAAGDCAYGDNRKIRSWLEEQQKSYVLCVSRKEYIEIGGENTAVDSILKNLPQEGWFTASCGNGSKGARLYDWMTVNSIVTDDWKRVLLVRRSKTDPDDLQAYICFSKKDVTVQKFIEVAGIRWTVETCFEESKSQVGLDQYEVRSYDGWYKHITFACLALALLTVLSIHSLDGLSFQQHNPGVSSLEAFKKGRNLLV